MSWDDVGPNHCHVDGTPRKIYREEKKVAKYDYGGGCPCGQYSECIPGCTNAGVTNVTEYESYDGYTVEKKQINTVQDDFGFSIVDEAELSVDTKTEQLKAMIMPLLLNLKANPDKDIIKWNGADRVKRIDDFIRKMDELLND